jgi:inorganic pyrophosphatase
VQIDDEIGWRVIGRQERASKEAGGDGDPLDVLLLGPAVPRGTVAAARLLGVLKLLDGGEQDDKLIAVTDAAPLEGVQSIAELDARYPGVTRILELWMTSYKGPGEMESKGYAGADVARQVLETASAAFTAGK